VSGGVNQSMNPLEKHDVHAKGNMDNISKIITIDISKTLGIMENVFISA
jgi:sulfur transfer complex TusBCD TusB component (DsrH family)